jgi:hypothetical protein
MVTPHARKADAKPERGRRSAKNLKLPAPLAKPKNLKKWIVPQIAFFFSLALIVILGAVKHIPKMFKSLISGD